MSSRVAGIASTSTAPTFDRLAATASGVVCVGVSETSALFSCFVGPQRPPKSAVVSFSGANAVLGVASVRDKPSKAAKGSLAVEGGGTGAGAGAERSPNKSETGGGAGAGGGSSGAPRSNKDGSGAGGGAGGGDRLAWRDDAFDALRGARRGAAVAEPTPPKP